MLTSIGSTSATQAAYAPATNRTTEQTAASTSTVAVTEEQAPSAPVLSAESAASARLGDQLNTQADAARVQRAVDESGVAAEASEETAEATTGADAAPAQPPAGGAAPLGGAGGAESSSNTTDTDYIAEADTNADKTVSDDERAVYEAKLREQAEESASKPLMSPKSHPLDAKTAEVRAAYGQDERSAPALEITA